MNMTILSVFSTDTFNPVKPDIQNYTLVKIIPPLRNSERNKRSSDDQI